MYDSLGRRISSTDQAGKVTQFFYDNLGRLIKVKDALNHETQYGYDELGQQITQTDAKGRITRYEYDKLGRRTKRTLPMGQVESYSYDLAGRLTSRRDFNNKVTTFTYDQLNRLLSKIPDSSFGQSPITFTYNSLGQRLTMSDSSGVSNYNYDNRNRLISKVTPQGTLTYAYNSVGNLVTLRSSNTEGVSLNYAYDNLNRLSTVTDNNLPTGQNQTSYNYDQVGNLASVTLPNQVVTNYQYNTLNRLTNVATSKAGTSISSYAYTLGAAGNRLSVSELSGRVINYTYDSIYRLTNETISGNANSTLNGSIDYAYDEVGNRLSRTSTLAAVPSQQNLSVDANDRLTTDSYDNNGSTISADGKTYQYDYENRIISVSGNGITISIKYDGDGNRVEKSVTQNGQTIVTKYLVDTNNLTGYAQVVEEIQNNVVSRQYSYGLDLINQRQLIGSNRVVHFYGYDGHGSVRYLTDINGAITDTYDYDAYGLLINQTGNTLNNYLYAGEQYDFDLGLYYNRARYLEVNRGRFWSQDSFEGDEDEPISLHKYLYGAADPINNLDPSGNSYIKTAITFAIASILSTISSLALVDRVLAPTGDPIKDEVSRTQADLDDAQVTLLLLGISALTPLVSVPSLIKNVVPSGATRRSFVRTLKVLQKTCFVEGTLVKTLNGDKPIEKIQIGDEVLTKNFETQQIEVRKVTATFSRVTPRVTTIIIRNQDDEPLVATPNHLFYVLKSSSKLLEKIHQGSWIEASKIEIGDYIQRASGEWTEVISIGNKEQNFTVYNFEVEDNHNYFVGKLGTLVHNGPCDNIRELAAKTAGQFKLFECYECKEALVKAFKKEGIRGKILELDTGLSGQGFENIYSDAIQNTISTNRKHVVVEIEGYIFDNIHKNGIPRADWEATLVTRQGNFNATFVKGKGFIKEEEF